MKIPAPMGDCPGRVSTLLTITRKELCDLGRNRTLLLSVFAPVVVCVLFVKFVESSHAAPPVRMATLGGCDLRVRSMLAATGAFDIRDVDTAAAARACVDNGTVDAALLLPSDFDGRLRSARPPDVTLVVRRDAGPRIAAAVSALTEVLRVRAGQKSPVALSLEAVGREEGLLMRGRLLVGFVVFVLLMGLGLVAASLVEERERGTMQAIRVTGVRPGMVLLGKALTMWFVCLLAALLMIGWCGLLRAPVGGLLAVITAGAGFAVCLGLWMGVLFPNLAAANAGLPVLFLILFVPAFLEDQLGWSGTRWLPSHAMVSGLQHTLVGGWGISTVWASALHLSAYAAACAVAAWWTMRAA